MRSAFDPEPGSAFTYLAAPYNDPDPDVRESRYRKVGSAAAEMMRRGEIVFSPISHSHPIAEMYDLPRDWAFWRAYDIPMLRACSKVVVLMLPGWRESVGVQTELEIAHDLGKPIEYMSGPSAEHEPRRGNGIRYKVLSATHRGDRGPDGRFVKARTVVRSVRPGHPDYGNAELGASVVMCKDAYQLAVPKANASLESLARSDDTLGGDVQP